MQHIGFIMDGNRTWAKERGLPGLEGHRKGYENAKSVIRLVKKRNIPFVSLWALSDDNIRTRSKEEMKYLFDLLARGILEMAKEAKTEGNRIVVVGNRQLLPSKCQTNIIKAEKMTENEMGTTVIIAVGYGGQDEIIRAIRSYRENGESIEDISVEGLKNHVETAKYPPPDLIIRTGGHVRHSGFLLFLCPYAEYYFSKKDWPDFSARDFDDALESFQKSERKFGK